MNAGASNAGSSEAGASSAGAPELVALGRVGRPHGIRGELRVTAYHPSSSLLFETETVRVGGAAKRVLSARPSGDVVLLALEGVTTREAADALKGQEIAVPRAALPPPADDELYLTDLVGCDCFERELALGRVTGVATYPASSCLVIEGEGGVREIPAMAPYLAGVDLGARRIEIAHAEDFPLETPRAKRSS
ncbi:MAG: ribosome maturation factor RimM [Sandaracinus sp.]